MGGGASSGPAPPGTAAGGGQFIDRRRAAREATGLGRQKLPGDGQRGCDPEQGDVRDDTLRGERRWDG